MNRFSGLSVLKTAQAVQIGLFAQDTRPKPGVYEIVGETPQRISCIGIIE